jgi:hypothetical protein
MSVPRHDFSKRRGHVVDIDRSDIGLCRRRTSTTTSRSIPTPGIRSSIITTAGDVPALLLVVAKIPGAGHHEPSAEDARRRIVSFFRTHLTS